MVLFLRWPFPLACLAGCLCIALAFAGATENDLSFFFTSDTLYLPALYRDLFHDGGSLLGWFLNPAPNFFPDMGSYFLLNALCGRFVLASYAYPMVQFVIIALLLRAIGRRAGSLDDRQAALGTMAMAALPLAGIAGDFPFAFQFLVNSFHMGAFVNTLLCTWLALRTIERSRKHGMMLAIVVLIATLSDKLFWVTFIAPCVLAMAFFAMRAADRRRMIPTATLILLAALASLPLLEAFRSAGPGMIEPPYMDPLGDRLPHAWSRFVDVFEQLLTWHVLTATITVIMLMTGIACCAAGSVVMWRELPHRKRPGTSAASWVRLILSVFFPVVLFAPVLSGSFDAADSLRYNCSVFPMGLFLAGAWVGRFFDRRWAGLVPALAAVTIVGAISGIVTNRGSWQRVWTYRPAIARDIDALAGSFPTRNGVTGYWQARLITMFSERGLVVLPSFPDLVGYAHVHRIGMFHRSIVPPEDPRRFSFVVLNNEPERERYVTKRWSGYYRLQRGATRVIVVPPFTYGDNIWHPEE